MRPRIPYFVAIPPATGPAPDWAMLHDYALIYPRWRRDVVRELGYRFDGHAGIAGRRRHLEARGILRSGAMGRGEVGLLHVRRFLAEVEPELRDLLDRFREAYDPERIAALGLPYR